MLLNVKTNSFIRYKGTDPITLLFIQLQTLAIVHVFT